MRGLIRSKGFVLFIVTVFMLILTMTTFKGTSTVNRITNFFTVPFAPIQKLISLSGSKVRNGIDFFRDIAAVRQQNEELKTRIDELEKENRELLEFRQENKELRSALNIKNQFADYEPLGANIIAKDLGNWFNIFTVDRGAKDNIGKNYPVVTSKGLVGRTVQVDAVSSKVEAIIDKNSIISARISQKGDLVRVKGDLQYKDQGLCILDRIPPEADIIVGDMIETSGVGGIYPRGILIGKVKEVRKSSDELNNYAIIQPSVDFRRLDEVIILKAYAADTGSDKK